LEDVSVYFIFNPIRLTINDNEIYIMQNLISADFFRKIPVRSLEMKKVYDNVEPETKLKYNSEVTVEELITIKSPCTEKKGPIRNEKWGDFFPATYKEVYFSESCSFMFAASIINKMAPYPVTKVDMLRILESEYRNQLEKFMSIYKLPSTEYYKKLLDILKNEGKNTQQYILRGISNDEIIYLMLKDDYYFTTTDVWLLFSYFKIPVSFLYSYKMKNMHDQYIFFTNSGKGVKYVFVIVPRKQNATYKYITNGDEILLDADVFCQRSGTERVNTYFEEFVLNHKMKKLNVL
jgi:hypothetical protein